MNNDKSILKATAFVTLITFLTKLLGLFKQVILAAICGASMQMDAFFVCSGIMISLCIVLFSSISISLLTIHTDTLYKNGRIASNDLINAVIRAFIPIALIISLLFYIFSLLVYVSITAPFNM